MRLTVKQMEVFHAIVVAGSISQARRVLGLSLSAALNAPIEKTRFGVFRM